MEHIEFWLIVATLQILKAPLGILAGTWQAWA
jgi:hypothetical protein